VETEEERRAPASEAGRQGLVNTGEVVTCLDVDERRLGRKRGMGRRPVFIFTAARWRGAKGRAKGGPCGQVHLQEGEGGEGGAGAVVASLGRPRTAPDRQARAAPLPREQGMAAGVGDEVSMTDGWDRGEAGPSGSNRGAREKRERDRVSVGHRHAGPGA
jgi:hypothetical protein